MASFQTRVIGALQLKAQAFEDVEHDRSATGQAAIVVALAAASVPLWRLSLPTVVMGVVVGLLGWVIGAFVLLIVGTKLLPGKNTEADLGQMLRTLGFAQAPGLFQVFGILPILGLLVALVLRIWVLVAMVIAVRQALDYEDTARAIVTCAVAWIIMLVITLAGAFFGIGSATVISGAL